MNYGDRRAGDTVDMKFTTFVGLVATSLAGSPVVSVYKDNGTTESTAGVTLTADFDGRTGLHHVRITTASDGAFYAEGSTFIVVVTTGTVSGQSVAGLMVGFFTLGLTSAVMPTTAGRKLDVSAGGEAGLDWANIGSPSTTQNLSATTIKTATDVETDTQDIQSRLPAALVSGRMDSSVGAYQTGLTPLQPTVAGRTLDVSAGGEAGIDWANIGSPTTVQGLSGTTVKTATDVETDTQDIQSRLPAALVSGRIDASVGAMAANVVTASAIAADAIGASELAADAAAEIATAVRTELTTELGRIDAATSTRATPAQVNAEVVDGLNVDTYAEPAQGAPGATISLAAKIGYLYKAFRNRKTQTATTMKLFADDAVTVDHKATLSDDGTTYDHGEIASGP